MATESSDIAPSASESTSSGIVVPGAKTLLYGFVAAGGTIALMNGVRDYQLYANGAPDAVLHLLGVVLTLGIGLTMLFVALAGAVATGIDHASGPEA